MCRRRLFLALAAGLTLTAYLHGECGKKQDHRSNKNAGLQVTDFTISGTQKISFEELAGIRSNLIGGCFDDDPEQLKEWVKYLFGNAGYFEAEVNSMRLNVADPVAVPKGVAIDADIFEGPRYKLAEVRFKGNRSFSTWSKFLLKKGDLFQRDNITSGFEDVRTLYTSAGYLDMSFIADTESLSNATVVLTLSIEEGPQYRMGKLDIFARKEVADKLRGGWKLREGAVFDEGYIDKYISENRSLLPVEFTRDSVQLVRNCPESSVEVFISLDAMDPSWQPLPKDITCEPQQ